MRSHFIHTLLHVKWDLKVFFCLKFTPYFINGNRSEILEFDLTSQMNLYKKYNVAYASG